MGGGWALSDVVYVLFQSNSSVQSPAHPQGAVPRPSPSPDPGCRKADGPRERMTESREQELTSWPGGVWPR